jgi:thymidylate synthase (FAD)
MIVVPQSVELIPHMPAEQAIALLERAARTCYQSKTCPQATMEQRAEFLRKQILAPKHHSVLEHVSVSMNFVTDRGCTHELVRHRLAAYSQESTRYAKQSEDVCFVRPATFDSWPVAEQQNWESACTFAESSYLQYLDEGVPKDIARSVLNNSLKTEILMTCNLREWLHVFELRCAPNAHFQIRDLLCTAQRKMQEYLPLIYGEP